MKKLLLTTAFILSTASANAASFSGNASVNISGVPININAVQPLQFGTLTKPTTDGASYRVAADGTKTATNITQTNVANVQPATFTVDAPSGAVNLSITDITHVQGLSLSNFDYIYNGVQGSGSGIGLPGGAAIPLVLGAELDVAQNVAMGLTQASYNIEVDYQ